jgi:hypothetical protein
MTRGRSGVTGVLLAGVVMAVCAGGAIAAAQAGAQPPHASEAACRLGAQVIAEEAAGSVFDGADEALGNSRNVANVGDRVPRNLKAVARKTAPSNLFRACPSLASELPAGDRMATDDDRAKLISGPAGLYVTSLATPILAPDGASALVYEFHRCAGLCGNGGLYLYKRVRGRWVKVDRLLLVVS